MSDTNRLLSEKELAQMLGITTFMVRKMRTQTGLPFIRAGFRIFYREQSVRNWLNAQETRVS